MAGKPLISWTIEASLQSKYVDTTIVSSDCDEILKIAKEFGAIAELRSSELSQDNIKNADVLLNLLEKYTNYDIVILLQPTSPLRDKDQIDNAIKELIDKNGDAIISVCENSHPPQWAATLPADKNMNNFISNINTKRSQEIETTYRLNGAIYIAKTTSFIKEKGFFNAGNIFAYVMDNEHSIDIDNEIDLKFATFLINERLPNK